MEAILEPNQSFALRPWQFNLRGLMFVTFVIALAAAAARLSVVLAVSFAPLLALALARTVCAARKSQITGQPEDARGGLLITFGRSLWIVTSLVVAGLAMGLTAVLVCLLYMLKWLGGAGRLIYVILRASLLKRIRLTRRACRFGESAVVRFRLREMFAWLRRRTVAALVALWQWERQMLRRYWLRGGEDASAKSRVVRARGSTHRGGRRKMRLQTS